MRIYLAIVTLTAVLLANSAPVMAGERSVTLGVDLWCPSCAYIADRTLARVDGVRDVTVSSRAKTATVIYDDERTSVAALTRAMAAVGLRSEVMAE